MIRITFRDEICSNFLFNAIIYVPRIFFISQTFCLFFRHEDVRSRHEDEFRKFLSLLKQPLAPHKNN